MLRLWKTTSVVLAIALTATACGAGTGSQGTDGTRANEMAGGITGQNARNTGRIFGDQNGNRDSILQHKGNTAANGARTNTMQGQRQDGPLISSDNRISPFPSNAVRPLGNTGGMGMMSAGNGARAGASSSNQAITVPYVKNNGENYVSVDTLVKVLQFKNYENEAQGVVEIGDTDVLFRLVADSVDAEKEGQAMRLSSAPKMVNGKMMLPVTAAADLFEEEMVYELAADGLKLFPSDTKVSGEDSDAADTEQVDEALDFADDPNDPFKGEDDEGAFSSPEEAEAAIEALEAIAADPEAVPALKNININAMIRTARKYMGVPYDFGAKPYPQSNRFDCSSFTQYVFGKYGIDLPRTARAQARIGKTVSRKSLRKGDLLYFYVPGRFKSNKKIGHVGIYIGNRMMIHSNTAPKDGVQLRSIDRAFWKKTFITAKRVAY